MGVPTLTQIHAQTDRVAALIKLQLAGAKTELTSATHAGLADQVTAVDDPDYESGLLPTALTVDEFCLPENYGTLLPFLLQRSDMVNLSKAWESYFKSGVGGSYGGMKAFLANKSASVHPLVGELFRSIYGESYFGTAPIGQCFAPNYQSRAADHVLTGTDGSLSDVTTTAANSGTLTLIASNNDCIYIRSRHRFSCAVISLSTLGSVTCAPEITAWDGSAYTTVAPTDNSAGLTKQDTIEFTPPANWTRNYKDASGVAFPGSDSGLFTLRIKRTAATLVTPPVGETIRIIPVPVLNKSGLHLGTDQPPYGLLRITGSTAIALAQLLPTGVAGQPNGTMAYGRFLPAAPGSGSVGLYLRALTKFGTTPVITLGFNDQNGAARTQAQSGWASPDALATQAIGLGSYTGMRALIGTGLAVTAGSQGVIEVFSVEARVPAL